jgi:hypothetical protein
LVNALCVEVIRTVRAGLDAACAAAATLCKAHAAPNAVVSSQQMVDDGPAPLLREAGAACAVMASLREYLAGCAAPLLALDAGARSTAADITRQTGTFVEAALTTTLAAAVAHSATAAERVLAAEQAKADFAPKLSLGGAPGTDSTALSADRPTVAAYRCAALLGMVRSAAMGAGLDDRNLGALCASLGDRIVVVLDAHFGSFKYTPAGGLRLKRDVIEYATLLSSWGLHPASTALTRLAGFGALANLLVAPTAALPGLVNGEGLGVTVRREEALRYLSLRTDFSKSKRPFSLLL